MATYFVGGETEVVNPELVNRPSEALQDHVARDMADLSGVWVPERVDGGVG